MDLHGLLICTMQPLECSLLQLSFVCAAESIRSSGDSDRSILQIFKFLGSDHIFLYSPPTIITYNGYCTLEYIIIHRVEMFMKEDMFVTTTERPHNM